MKKLEPYINQELADYFTFDVPGAKFVSQYRIKYWDGKIRLCSTNAGEIYVGLLDKIVSWAKKSDYTVSFEIVSFTELLLKRMMASRKKESKIISPVSQNINPEIIKLMEFMMH